MEENTPQTTPDAINNAQKIAEAMKMLPVNEKRSKKKLVIIITAIVLGLALTATLLVIFLVPKKVDIKLSELRDMTPSEAKRYFGRPDRTSDNGRFIYDNEDGRLTFYGIKISNVMYDQADHEISLWFFDDNDFKNAVAKIRKFAKFKKSYIYNYYTYNEMEILFDESLYINISFS